MWLKRGMIKFQGYSKTQKRVGLALVILIIALIVFSSYFLFFYTKQCDTAECFVSAIANCKRVSWIREDIQANWLYTITGDAKGDSCSVEVRLLKIKEGTIENEELQGKKMDCIILKNDIKLPEKQLSQCTGLLKEELQGIIIKEIHDYLLNSVGEIKEEFEGI